MRHFRDVIFWLISRFCYFFAQSYTRSHAATCRFNTTRPATGLGTAITKPLLPPDVLNHPAFLDAGRSNICTAGRLEVRLKTFIEGSQLCSLWLHYIFVQLYNITVLLITTILLTDTWNTVTIQLLCRLYHHDVYEHRDNLGCLYHNCIIAMICLSNSRWFTLMTKRKMPKGLRQTSFWYQNWTNSF